MNKRAALGLLCLLFSVSTLNAQTHEVWVSSGLTAGPLSSPQLDFGSGFRLGFRLGLNANSVYGHEFQYAYSLPSLTDHSGAVLGMPGSDQMEIHQAGYNFLYYTRRAPESGVRPFITGGVHFDDFVLPGNPPSEERWRNALPAECISRLTSSKG